jgi:glycosyltransferase involved in cell wall biosynthesis
MIILLGPVHPYRGGGITSFNERLLKELQAEGHEVMAYNFTLLYPDFLFPGKSQMADHAVDLPFPAPRLVNAMNPLNWIKVGRKLRKAKPEIIIVRYWLPLLGPCLGTILRLKHKDSKVVCIADNVIPHEKRPGDKPFTQYFVKPVSSFITMSKKVLEDLRLFTDKPAVQVPHPLYDQFGPGVAKDIARQKLHISPDEKVILFFGFIRKYKGLDLLLEGMADPRIGESGIKLMIAGEYYDDRAAYSQWLDNPVIASRLIQHTDFIPDQDIPYYFGAADFIIQPYKSATQSGVTPLAYFYEKAMLVTNVGGLPDLVPDKEVGLVVEPEPKAIADGILELYRLGEAHFRDNLLKEKAKYGWAALAQEVLRQARIFA